MVIMKRRAFLGLTSAPWFVPLSGCIFNRASDQGLGRSVDITIYNLTEHEQNAVVTITENSDETIYSEQHPLSPKNTDNYNDRAPEVGRANRMYHVEVTTDDLRTEQEVEPSQAGVIDITIREEEIKIQFAPLEG